MDVMLIAIHKNRAVSRCQVARSGREDLERE